MILIINNDHFKKFISKNKKNALLFYNEQLDCVLSITQIMKNNETDYKYHIMTNDGKLRPMMNMPSSVNHMIKYNLNKNGSWYRING